MSFLPKDFIVPQKLDTNRMRLRMLTVSDVVKDFDAVVSRKNYLLETKPFGPNQKWPDGLTLEQNLIDLGWHQKEFQMRTTFAFTVLNLEETKCLGCIYIEPTTKFNFDAKVYLWVRGSEALNGLDEHLFETVKNWINEKWPFKNVAYPGRSISWEKWQNN